MRVSGHLTNQLDGPPLSPLTIIDLIGIRQRRLTRKLDYLVLCSLDGF